MRWKVEAVIRYCVFESVENYWQQKNNDTLLIKVILNTIVEKLFVAVFFDKLTVLKFPTNKTMLPMLFRLHFEVLEFCDNGFAKVMMYKNVQKEEKH